MIRVCAVVRLDGGAWDARPGPGRTSCICSPDFLTPYGHQSVATIRRPNCYTTIEVSTSWMYVTRMLLLIPSAGPIGSGKPTKPALVPRIVRPFLPCWYHGEMRFQRHAAVVWINSFSSGSGGLYFSQRGGPDGVIDSLLFAQHAIETFRRSLPNGAPNHRLDQLANRLAKILAETRKLNPAG